jgi:hypothetical protein
MLKSQKRRMLFRVPVIEGIKGHPKAAPDVLYYNKKKSTGFAD